MQEKNDMLLYGDITNEKNGPLIERAIVELAGAGFGTPAKLADLTGANAQMLVIDGDASHTCTRLLSRERIVPDYHLVVTDLGIEADGRIDSDDLQLLKDGIQACCTPTDGPTPAAHCPWCS